MGFDKSLLEHAARYWDAERENAARLTQRSTLTMTALGALFGLGLFRIEWFRGVNDVLRMTPHFACWSKICLVAGLLFFVIAFILTMRSSRMNVWGMVSVLWRTMTNMFRKAHNPEEFDRFYNTASEHLRFSPEQIKSLPKQDESEARMIVFSKVYKSAEELRKRNIMRAKHMHRANFVFAVGLVAVGVAVLLYIIGSEPTMIP